MKINWNFLGSGGGGCKTKKPSVGGVWIFSGQGSKLRYKNRQTVKNNHSPKFDHLKDTVKDNTDAGDEGF